MIKRIAILYLCAASATALHASSPAATQAWVSNYVETVMQDAGVTPTELPTNAVAGTIDVAAHTLTFTYEGETYTVGITATNEIADVSAFKVYSSTDASAVPTGTVFALDESTGHYVNNTVAFPNDMALTVTNGCNHLSQSNGVWRTIGSGSTNLANVVVESNRVFQFSFSMRKLCITPTEARHVGVANAANYAWVPVRKTALEYVLELICGTAHAETTGAPAAESFVYRYTLTLKDGSTRYGSVVFSYGGEYYDWDAYPDDGYPAADKSHHYVPNSWPYSEDWTTGDNWKAEGESGGKITITSYIKKGGEYVPVEVAVSRTKLVALTGVSISASIPAYRPPEYVTEEAQNDRCEKGDHYWVNCVCTGCGKKRNHNLVAGAAGTCDRCSNKNGQNSDPSGEVCGSSCSIGGNRSAQEHHHGWHDGDGLEKNMMACTCECYGKDNCAGWQIVHDPSGEKSDIGEGYREEDGTVSESSKKSFHHYSVNCQRDRGDGDVCDAPVNYNETHDFRSADGSRPSPFIGDKSEEESVVILSYGEQSPEANETEHYCGDMTCSVCQREKAGYDEHAFETGSCICLGCGLALHAVSEETGRRDDGYYCGEKKVPGCSTCNTYSRTGDPVAGRESNLTEALHFKNRDGICENEYTHVCQCGRVAASHCMSKTSESHWECRFCPYEYDGETPPCGPGRDYIVDGWCGHWVTRLGVELPGGGQYETAEGTLAAFPSAHAFEEVPGYLCLRCTNVNPLTLETCNRCDKDAIENHGGWHHARLASTNQTTSTSGNCVCECCLFRREHRSGTHTNVVFVAGPTNTCLAIGWCENLGPCEDDVYCNAPCTNIVDHNFVATNTPPPSYLDETNHLVRHICIQEDGDGCGLVTNFPSAHVLELSNAPPVMVDATNHLWWMVCTGDEKLDVGCGWATPTNEVHLMSALEWIKTGANCMAYYRCVDDCGYTNAVLPLANHVASGNDSNLSYETFSNCYHSVYDRCVREWDDVVCNRRFKVREDHCEAYASGAAAITLTNDLSAKDFYPCRLCKTGHAVEVPHNWRFNSTEHWCKQVAADNEHLRDVHVMVNNKCTVCGYTPGGSDDDEYRLDPVEVSCRDNCCYYGAYAYHRTWRTNGVEIAESDRGPWLGGEFTYASEWMTCRYHRDGVCKCPYCSGVKTGLLYNSCYCPHVNSGDLLKFTEAIISGSYHLRYAGSSYKIVDFSDPVYEVGPLCFDEAFVSMKKLYLVNAQTITNVGEYAFRNAFTNDTNLAEVWFNGLKRAGWGAFEGAFQKCPLGFGAIFVSLQECGSGCFSGAFKESQIESLRFTSLTNANDTLDLFGGTPDLSMRSLYLPVLASSVGSGGHLLTFADMPNLETLDLSSASTNAINSIGDLSHLAALTRLDFHNVSGIPNYYGSGSERHAPTNNPNCKIVVPNGLCDAWRVAPGWSNICNQIVPYSNQVIRPFVTVSFDTDCGEPIPSVQIASGSGIVAPTNTYRFASSLGGADDGGFSFAGWFTDETLATAYVNGAPFETNATLFAKWTDSRIVRISTPAQYLSGDVYNLTCSLTDAKLGLDLTVSSGVSGYFELEYADGTTVGGAGTTACALFELETDALHISPLVILSSAIGATSDRMPVRVRVKIPAPDGTTVTSNTLTFN